MPMKLLLLAMEIAFFKLREVRERERNAQFPCAQVFTINSLGPLTLRAANTLFFVLFFIIQNAEPQLSHIPFARTEMTMAIEGT